MSVTAAPFTFMASSCFVVVVILVLVALVPRGAQADIVACANVTSKHYKLNVGNGDMQLHLWGADQLPNCYGSGVTGLPQVRSFTFWLKTCYSYSGTPTTAMGNIIDDNVMVASVNITNLLPTDSATHTMTADFGQMIKLNTSRTYTFTFCVTGGGNTRYSMEGSGPDDANFRYCFAYEMCFSGPNNWNWHMGYSLRTCIVGSCGSTVASPVLHLVLWGALAHVTALLTTLWH
jgi:hypothetical protein